MAGIPVFAAVLVEILRRQGGSLIFLLVLATLVAGFLQEITFGSGYAGGVRLPGLLGLAVLGVSVCLLLARSRGRLTIPRSHCGVAGVFGMGFIVLNVISLLFGILRYSVLDALTDADWLVWIGVLFLVVGEMSPHMTRRMLLAFWGLSVILSLQGVMNLAQERGTFLTTGGSRYVSGSAAQFIASGLVVSGVWFLLLAKRRYLRRLLLGASMVQFFAILISFNRQTWVALCTTVVVGFLIFFKGRRLHAILTVVVVLSALLALVVLADQFSLFPTSIRRVLYNRIGLGASSRAYLADSAIQFRLAAWRVALQGIADAPILGKGWGSPLVFRTGGISYNMSPHNTYLWMAYKSGVPALILYLAFIISLLTMGCRHYLAAQSPSHRATLAIALLVEILYSVGALWWDYLTAMYVSIPIWLNRGLLISHCSQLSNLRPKE